MANMIKNNGNILYVINFSISNEKRFLFCMVFSVYEVIRVACLTNQLRKETSHANDFVLTLKAMQ